MNRIETVFRNRTNASVEKLTLLNKEAREEMRKEMLYAIRSAVHAKQAKTDLDDAVATGVKKNTAYEEKAAASPDASEEARSALKTEIADNADEVTRMIKDAVDTDARAQASLRQQTAAAINNPNDNISVRKEVRCCLQEARWLVTMLRLRTISPLPPRASTIPSPSRLP